MKKDTYWFPHDYNARNDIKIKKLISKLGQLGYGVFWSIVEELYNNENSLPTDYECLAIDMKTKVNIIESVINDFGLFVFDGETFGSLSIQRRLDDRNTKSNKARESVKRRWERSKENIQTNNDSNTNVLQTNNDSNTIKEKEKKVKQKEDINIPFSEFWDLYDNKHDAKKCEQKWNALTNDERSQAMQHIPKYKISTPDKNFRKHPATYLNNKSFNNEIIEINGGQDAINKKPSANSRQRGGSITDVEKEFAKW